MATEMKENPEFFKAFPHLQGPLYATVRTGAQYLQYMDNVSTKEFFADSELKGDNYYDANYFQSLQHQHNKYLAPETDREEMLRENELNFVQGSTSPVGPYKYMSQAAKDLVHAEIDQKMQDLEDTGLTRCELLFERQEGLRLADDPFFQFLKNNRTAREMLLKPGEEFTADRVVELALR